MISTGVTSAGGSDSSVFNESSLGNLRVKADTRRLFGSVSGLWPRTGEGLPLQWPEVPCSVRTMCVTAFKTELERKKITLSESVEQSFFQVSISLF